MRWCFEESSAYAEKILDGIIAGQQAYVPMLCLYEVISVMAASQRRGTLSTQKAHGFLEDLRMLDIEIDSETSPRDIFVSAHSLAVKHRLTGYDAVYLELAMRKGLPLASLDSDLNKAAEAVGVALVTV